MFSATALEALPTIIYVRNPRDRVRSIGPRPGHGETLQSVVSTRLAQQLRGGIVGLEALVGQARLRPSASGQASLAKLAD